MLNQHPLYTGCIMQTGDSNQLRAEQLSSKSPQKHLMEHISEFVFNGLFQISGTLWLREGIILLFFKYNYSTLWAQLSIKRQIIGVEAEDVLIIWAIQRFKTKCVVNFSHFKSFSSGVSTDTSLHLHTCDGYIDQSGLTSYNSGEFKLQGSFLQPTLIERGAPFLPTALFLKWSLLSSRGLMESVLLADQWGKRGTEAFLFCVRVKIRCGFLITRDGSVCTSSFLVFFDLSWSAVRGEKIKSGGEVSILQHAYFLYFHQQTNTCRFDKNSLWKSENEKGLHITVFE